MFAFFYSAYELSVRHKNISVGVAAINYSVKSLEIPGKILTEFSYFSLSYFFFAH
jgi:hypothetical protein